MYTSSTENKKAQKAQHILSLSFDLFLSLSLSFTLTKQKLSEEETIHTFTGLRSADPISQSQTRRSG